MNESIVTGQRSASTSVKRNLSSKGKSAGVDRSAGLDSTLAQKGPIFDDPNVIVDAASSGQGIALGFLPLAKEDLSSERLVVAHEHISESRFGYYIVMRDITPLPPKVKAFRD